MKRWKGLSLFIWWLHLHKHKSRIWIDAQNEHVVDESPFIHDIHPNAGTVTGHQQTAQEHWAAQHVNPNSPPINIFDPFASELDWRTAKWFLEDGSSKSASDRLLKIDGVCLLFI
ncbi:hypothetical protein DFH11DRAFT_1516600 [Phellopilus nigrolimitatus]|nr:hypothetical protein DFH11DRAFT_1516600 [Phellopilus nigrolimitatus]